MAADPRQMPDHEQREYFAAREVWKRRDEQTPSGKESISNGGDGLLWRDWFKARFGREIEEAAKDYGRRK